jgi:ferredoxin--NADP+ reductase
MRPHARVDPDHAITENGMAALRTERVLSVRHWNETLFSFTTTRDPGLRFDNGQFLMIGLEVDGKPLLRAYSIASANHEEHLEFFSIKVQNGALTSRLQHLLEGQEIFVSRKPTGTLVLRDLRPGRRLFLLSTGTGLAPFMSLVKDPEMYERFEKIVLVHGVRTVSELAYAEYLSKSLPEDALLGEYARSQLVYYPTVTREPFRNRGRLTELITSGRLFADLEMPPLDPANDRAMICGSPTMLGETAALLDARGFGISPHIGTPGDYVIERAFVEKP